VGRVLRAYSVDELPQLINVIRGEMSLVGPRPVVTSELTRYGNAAVHYLSARPGITGLWQVSGRSDTTYACADRARRALRHRMEPSGDIVILLRTIPAVSARAGPVEPAAHGRTRHDPRPSPRLATGWPT
jgi:exopolysaccharide production protein ExoY